MWAVGGIPVVAFVIATVSAQADASIGGSDCDASEDEQVLLELRRSTSSGPTIEGNCLTGDECGGNLGIAPVISNGVSFCCDGAIAPQLNVMSGDKVKCVCLGQREPDVSPPEPEAPETTSEPVVEGICVTGDQCNNPDAGVHTVPVVSNGQSFCCISPEFKVNPHATVTCNCTGLESASS
ncbi:unnamed protein product [Prorocentrum cordatum]|uniref:Uncharacterized protein n=1 Tax=Prorocentrum cordatum TaxID=2364126 RepID=A0ABN9SA49_9DINO|nr:unnamed protein product [Polarella glacialis]|mmetsp:Transcript_93932/g.244671  ORF Transcript_93932/g.244671 Transcript_93932/m.244671 type:complete len:181 (-) Transcript_93932:115-657(-)